MTAAPQTDALAQDKTGSEPIRTETIIIGSGFSGLGMGISLLKDGRKDFIILEKASEVGGTWRDNHYPGAACDVPTALYSYSFETRSDWKNLWSYQPEIQNYLTGVADKYNIRPHVQFNKVAVRGFWSEPELRWHLFTSDNQEYISQFVVSAIGALHIPSIPKIAGLDKFGGAQFHSAEWDHSVDLTGKRVAVIGTGASAIQFVPMIVDEVGELKLFQRTAAWVMPRQNVEIPKPVQKALATVPGLRKGFRNSIYWGAEFGAYAMNKRPVLLKAVEIIGKRFIASQIDDPETVRKLTPDYRPGCKRLLGSNTFYKALNQPKSSVITDNITKVTPKGIVTADGQEHEIDVIIYGTGFHVTDSFESLAIAGRNGFDLVERFRAEGPQAHRGITVADAPNAFFLLGPNTGLGHTSIVFMIESQIRYVTQAMQEVRRLGVEAIEPRREVQDAYNEDVQEKLAGSVWNTGGCQSWYLDEHGNNRTLWPGYTWKYWLSTRRVKMSEYELITRPSLSPAASQSADQFAV